MTSNHNAQLNFTNFQRCEQGIMGEMKEFLSINFVVLEAVRILLEAKLFHPTGHIIAVPPRNNGCIRQKQIALLTRRLESATTTIQRDLVHIVQLPNNDVLVIRALFSKMGNKILISTNIDQQEKTNAASSNQSLPLLGASCRLRRHSKSRSGCDLPASWATCRLMDSRQRPFYRRL